MNRLCDFRAALCLLATGLAFGMAGCAPKVLDETNAAPSLLQGSSAGSSGPACTGTPSTTLLYVGPSGNDGNCGTTTTPYATIGKALSTATGAAVINISPGTYSAASGETFPISVPSGMTLIGDTATSGVGPPATIISGSGVVAGVEDPNSGTTASAAIVASNGATIEGFSFSSPAGAPTTSEFIVIPATVTGVTVANNTLTGASSTGIFDAGPGPNTFTGNVITGSGFAAFSSECITGNGCTGGVTSGEVFRSNVFASSGSYGVFIESSSGGGTWDFGTSGSPGNNTFCGSTRNSMSVNVISPGASVSAIDNAWPDSPPTVSGTDPTDIFTQNPTAGGTPIANFTVSPSLAAVTSCP